MVATAELDNWQSRLDRHFVELQQRRSKEAPGRSVFALEHGLDVSDVQELSLSVRRHIDHSPPSREHSLAWIVYAAELGYRYAGDEYWQTFEKETPGWVMRGDRHWVRSCFRAFQKKYGGAEPSGTWAKHFSIICWPITHAILPRDLQRQLARILYEVRHSYSGDIFDSPFVLGELIGARSWNATSRFQNFAQEAQLVGQIAAALLLQGESNNSSLIHPATLKRISSDLDRERRGREWLRGARQSALERAHIRGLGSDCNLTPPTVRQPEEARAEAAALGIEPRLVLKPTNVGRTSWNVWLEIPDLTHLLFKFPQTREVLTGSRCVVAGASGRPLARERCLHGAQWVRLSRWPREDEVLLQFEQMGAQLEYLLRTECLMRPGPSWLFWIASDELAYESRTLRVRPGQRYILVTASGTFAQSEYVHPIDVECDGVQAAILNLPTALTSDWENSLRRLGLSHAKTIEVWPAGLGAVVWDGEGHGEWLASECPCLAIRTDHPINALMVSMRGSSESSLEITPITPGEPIFVEFPELPIGLHTVRVSTRSGPEAEPDPLGDLEVLMRVREARAWSPGVSPRGPLQVQLNPAMPTLEQLWAGRAEVTIGGPVGRTAKCRASLLERDSEATVVSKELPLIHLPVTAEIWKVYFDKHFRSKKDVQGAYDNSRVCELDFNADELGAFTVRCEREFIPLRWAVRRHGNSHIVRLLDDSGGISPPIVTRHEFETPAAREQLQPAFEFDTPVEGGLYVARMSDYTAAIIVPPMIRGLADLRCDPRFDLEARSVTAVARVIEIAGLWGRARITGDLFSEMRQRIVLQSIARHISRLLGGDRWAEAEYSVNPGNDLTNLKRAISKNRTELGLGAALARDVKALMSQTCKERVDYLASLASRYLMPSTTPSRMVIPTSARPRVIRQIQTEDGQDTKWLAEFALRLASDPAGAEGWAGERLSEGISRLLDVPSLVRAARFQVIATSYDALPRAAFDELYAGWRWE